MALDFKKQVITSKEQVVDAINETQEQTSEIVRQLNNNDVLNSVFFSNVFLSTSATLVRHGLGYEPRAWIATNKQANIEVFEDTSIANPDRTQFIYLVTSSGSYDLNILFF